MQTNHTNEIESNGMLRSPTGLRIVASKDWIPGNAGIESARYRDDGTLDITWTGETRIGWDGQFTEEVGGQRIFLDENSAEWQESQLELVHPVTGAVIEKKVAGNPPADEYATMNDEDLKTALGDLAEAIRSITLGSVEEIVIAAAGEALIRNWNDHGPITPIDEDRELDNWERVTGIPR